jgi:hypothetical protein
LLAATAAAAAIRFCREMSLAHLVRGGDDLDGALPVWPRADMRGAKWAMMPEFAVTAAAVADDRRQIDAAPVYLAPCRTA